MLVSIYSLRKVWNGSIVVLLQGLQDDWFLSKLKELKCFTAYMPESNDYPLSIKPTLHRYVNNFDLVMFLDADTLVLNPIDEYFMMIAANGFVTGNFANWKTTGSSISRRINAWKKACPELIAGALAYGAAINTGINGWISGDPALEKWNEICQRGYEKRCTTRIVDEIACQLMLPLVEHRLAGTEWGESVRFGTVTKDTKIIHYHGHKHVGRYKNCEYWKKTYSEMRENGFIDIEHSCFHDSSVEKWLQEKDNNADLCTLVTAVNNKYLHHFLKNWKLWQNVEPIKHMKKIVFADSKCIDFVITEVDNSTRVITWPNSSDLSDKEHMLSAFVFGVAKNVKTRYWIKMDCDVTPKCDKIEIPEEAWDATLTASPWGYTKIKHDPIYEKNGIHWLHLLDWWADKLPDFNKTKPLFSGLKIEQPKHRHKRICTFFSIEKTAFTKHLARMCGGKMPIPSQDTLVWYVITRLGGKRRIVKHNFRQYLTP
jgi:hypothetical protein